MSVNFGHMSVRLLGKETNFYQFQCICLRMGRLHFNLPGIDLKGVMGPGSEVGYVLPRTMKCPTFCLQSAGRRPRREEHLKRTKEVLDFRYPTYCTPPCQPRLEDWKGSFRSLRWCVAVFILHLQGDLFVVGCCRQFFPSSWLAIRPNISLQNLSFPDRF